MNWPASVTKFCNAIKIAEGSNPDWNNPGDLTGADKGNFQVWGTANSEGVWKFVYAADGWNALCIKVNRILMGHSLVYPLVMTISELGMKYSGKDPNWAKNVAAELGVPETMTIGEWVEANPLGDA